MAATGDSDSESGSDDDDAHGAASPRSPERLPGADEQQDRLKREAHNHEDGSERAPDVESGSGKRHVRHEPRSETVDAETLDEAAHFMTYAFAAYGYLLYIWGKPG